MAERRVANIRGTATRSSAGSTDIIAAQGATKRLMVTQIIVTIHTFTASGKVIISDGTTEYFGIDASTVAGGQPPPMNFPDGFKLGLNKALVLETEEAIEAFAYAAAESR